MLIRNGRIYLEEPRNITFPMGDTIGMFCDGTEVMINILTVFRIMAILEKDCESQNISMENLRERLSKTKQNS